MNRLNRLRWMVPDGQERSTVMVSRIELYPAHVRRHSLLTLVHLLFITINPHREAKQVWSSLLTTSYTTSTVSHTFNRGHRVLISAAEYVNMTADVRDSYP